MMRPPFRRVGTGRAGPGRPGGRRRVPARVASQSGQVLPFTVITLLGFLLLLFGVAGYAEAEAARLRLQVAADAAALAATGQAEPWLALSVQRHLFRCAPEPAGGLHCGDAGATVWNLRPTFEPDLVRTGPGGLPGWAAAAGCSFLSDAAAGTPAAAVVVCDGWRLRSDVLGAGYGFGYPPGAAPERAARALLQANLGPTAADVIGFATDGSTGAVTLTVRVREPANPLALVTRGPVTLTVQAGARPRLRGPLPGHS